MYLDGVISYAANISLGAFTLLEYFSQATCSDNSQHDDEYASSH